jgi:drug/metabolite transporter (DMT)-like permease
VKAQLAVAALVVTGLVMVAWAVNSRNLVMVVPGALTVIAAGLLFAQFQTRRS